MSIARHHAEWLSLIEISGPFLSMPVLLRAFPQGLDALDPDLAPLLRAAYEEWLDNQGGTRPDPSIHLAWVEWVLRAILEMPDDVLRGRLRRGTTSSDDLDGFTIAITEYGETLCPDFVIVEPSHRAEPDAGPTARLLVQVVPPGQDLEKPLVGHRWVASPATRMMTLLHALGVRLGLVTNGERWMLVDAPKGETTGYVSWYANLWLEEPLTLRAFRSLLNVRRFFGVAESETIEALLAASATDQQEVTDQLGAQVRRAVELLVQAIDLADQDRGRTLLDGVSEEQVYEAAVTVMMRLVFLFCAEERGLLLLGDELYDQHYAVSTLRAQLREAADQFGEEVLEHRFDAWCRLLATFRAVHGGIAHDRLPLPAYGGSLFDPDRFPFLEGRPPKTRWRQTPARPLPISNRTVLHLLDALQTLQVKVLGGGPAEARRLSFRALDVEQIGYVYEGLLDHTAKRATTPVLGLAGTKEREPEIPLPTLEDWRAKGDEELVRFLHEQTGRSTSALQRSLQTSADALLDRELRAACGNDIDLYQRVLPFARLLRNDSYGRPVVIPAGSIYVTAGHERRATGTQYTPRSLTEPIVEHTLEPLVYEGPAEGWPRERWQLRPPSALLDLKICDMAMGSGAFLVQACRYLAARLVEAWEEAERVGISPAKRLITPEGQPTSDPNVAIPASVDDRLVLAQRLIVERCLYGVDKNPLAVEIAKLSLWLVTLAKDRPFSFLDHALKPGDSLVGVDLDQLKTWSLTPQQKAGTFPLLAAPLETALRTASGLRRRIAATPVRDARDAEEKAKLLAQANETMDLVRLGADLLIASAFAPKPKERERLRKELQEAFVIPLLAHEEIRAGKLTEAGATPAREAIAALREQADRLLAGQRPFHWPLEFPEVFEDGRGGFDAFVGNPPFLGGKKISTVLGENYANYLRSRWQSAQNTTDLAAYFFLRSFEHLHDGGTFGLIATNTIAQGDTRVAGLEHLSKCGATIYRAIPSMPWPGVAAVHVSVVYVRKGAFLGAVVLAESVVPHISSYLDSTPDIDGPKKLAQNTGKSFIGVFVRGIGFVLEQAEAERLIASNPRNREVIRPYLTGEDLNDTPDQSPSRYVIDFSDWPLTRAERYPDCLEIVRARVYPERQKVKQKDHRERWWQFANLRPGLYRAIAPLRRVLAVARVSRTVAFVFVPKGWVYNEKVVVFATEGASVFSTLQSSIHNAWAWQYSSTLKSDLNYAPTDCFETFPFPGDLAPLEAIGESYHEHRRQIMLARQEGLTKTYNRFHDPKERAADIARLRELHVAMDHAVAAAYGWDDLLLEHGFHETPQGLRFTISEAARREVLARLLALNHKRYEEEVRAGLHKDEKRKTRGKGLRRGDEERGWE